MKQKLILVDDDFTLLALVDSILSKEGYEVESFSNPKKALEYYKKEPSPVVISDLNMPEMDGIQFSNELLELENKPVIIILTSESGIKNVINLMRNGVYDYITKNFIKDELVSRVKSAFEIAEFRKMQKNIIKERELRIENQLNWNLWKESLIKKDTEKSEANLIGNLNNSLIQGAGIGLMSSLVQMIKEKTIAYNEKQYLVDKELMDMVFTNAEVTNQLTFMLGEIDYVINSKLSLETITLLEFRNIIQSISDELIPLANLKNQKMKIGINSAFNDNKYKIALEKNFFQKVLKELYINAFKFSLRESSIYVLFEINKDTININFLSIPEIQDGVLGIKDEYQYLVFEPFYRISKTVQEGYGSLDFGLGLSYVQKVVHAHSGKMSAYNLKNYLDQSGTTLVCFTIELPLLVS